MLRYGAIGGWSWPQNKQTIIVAALVAAVVRCRRRGGVHTETWLAIEHWHAPQLWFDGLRVTSETSVLMELFYPPRIIKKSLQKWLWQNKYLCLNGTRLLKTKSSNLTPLLAFGLNEAWCELLSETYASFITNYTKRRWRAFQYRFNIALISPINLKRLPALKEIV